MMDFLIKHKLFNPSQHGFLKAKSCLTNLLCVLEEITKWVDDGSPVVIIYLDFQKAFDKVPNQRLKVGLYFRRRQAPRAPPHDAPVRSISWRGPAGVNVRQCRGKKYKRTRV